jgi:hypothetical protein
MEQANFPNDEDLMILLDVNGKKYVHNGINAVMFYTLFTETNWLPSIQIERKIFEAGNRKIILIDVKSEELGLK